MAKQKRDNDYYLRRLKDGRPDVYADHQADKFGSVTEALIAGGVRKQVDQLKHLQARWAKATQAERDAFKIMIGCVGTSAVTTPVAAPTSRTAPALVHTNRVLTPAAVAEITAIMARRKMKPGEVMKEMGFKSLNASLPTAMARGTKLQPALLIALEGWIKANTTP